MTRGTWQGSGTWQTTGSGPGLGAVLAAAAGVAAFALAGWAAARIWWIAAAVGVSLAGAVVMAVWLVRRGGLIGGAPPWERGVLAGERPVLPLRAAAEQAVPPPVPAAIEQHVHYHIHAEEAAAIIQRTLSVPVSAREEIQS